MKLPPSMACKSLTEGLLTRMAPLQRLLDWATAPSSFEEAGGGAGALTLAENKGCAPGYRCMSLTSEFGLQHHGEYQPLATPQLPARFDQRPVWEWGCPARGAQCCASSYS